MASIPADRYPGDPSEPFPVPVIFLQGSGFDRGDPIFFGVIPRQVIAPPGAGWGRVGGGGAGDIRGGSA